MRSEFTWGGDFPLPVNIERSVERSVKNRYDLMMSVEAAGVDIFVKAQMAWTIARSEFGFSIPMVNYEKIGKSLGVDFCWFSVKEYMDCLVKAGHIGWYRSRGFYVLWGFEHNADRIKEILGEYKSIESPACNEQDDPAKLQEKINSILKEVGEDPFIDTECSSSASSEAETPFDAGETVPAEKPADQPIPHKKSFLELIGRE